jgi:phosphoribosylaminoimidazole-succinocarboxamide synthase
LISKAKPIFTPSSKASVDGQDININFDDDDMPNHVRNVFIAPSKMALDYALKRGIIISDTKFEFGIDENNQLVLTDDILTSESSRY